jgi:hypothetical protein
MGRHLINLKKLALVHKKGFKANSKYDSSYWLETI